MLKSRLASILTAFCLLAPLSLGLSGCEDEVEVETPSGEVEIEEDGDVEAD